MKILVWVLIVSSWNSSRNEVEQLGYYADKESCIRVQQSEPVKNFKSECIQISVVK